MSDSYASRSLGSGYPSILVNDISDVMEGGNLHEMKAFAQKVANEERHPVVFSFNGKKIVFFPETGERLKIFHVNESILKR